MLVSDIIHLNGKHRRDDEALVVDGRRLTYGELDGEIDQVVRALAAAGVGQSDRIAVLGKNSLPYFLLYFAAAKTGALLVPLNFWHRAAEHEYTLGDSAPSILFVEPALLGSVDGVAPELRRVVLPAGDDAGEWAEFLRNGEGTDVPSVDISPDDPHMILYTSGTTGRPKGALLSHRRTVEDALGMTAVLRVRSDDTFVNYFPPFHVGNWDHMKLFLLVGARVVLLREFDAAEVLRLVPEEHVSVILGVPTMLHELLNHPDFDETDKSSIRLVYYGAYDPSGIMRRTAEVFGVLDGTAEMAHTFGLTEAGPFVTLCRANELLDHWGSIGRPIPGVEVELLDESGQPVPVGQPGELCVRGPRMSGYWNNAEATAAALEGDWLHTGDIAVADDEGFLFIVDRKKDMIRSGGQNVYSKEVEDCLGVHDAVAEVGVIGLPDPVYEERVCAIVVLRPGHVPDETMAEELRRHVRSSLAGYNTPRDIQFVDSLPRTPVGKIQKHVLREQFGSMFDVAAHSDDKA